MNIKALMVIVIAVIVSLGIAFAAGQNALTTEGGTSLFVIAALIAFAVNWLAFIPANIFKTEKFYDLTGAITYLSVIIITSSLAGSLDWRAVIVGAFVIVWALRLGSFLFMRIHADGKDIRFDEIKVNPIRFLVAWTLQGTWVFLTSASALAIITSASPLPLDIYAYVGMAIWVFGFTIEVIADCQKKQFRNNPDNKGKFINVGLWSWSRHPNYFGEITLWTGITIMSLPLLSGWQWVTLISPIFVILLLTRISGIPTLQRTTKKRWGDDKDYQDYVKNTSLLIPLPPKG